MLSAINSKLRRRNSHGAPLGATAPQQALPKVGAQRTSKNTQKLKLLPNPETAEDGPDEESGRDVYAQFTRIKDPTARRDAARLGKADRDRLPRVSAYCTASQYRLDGVMRFMKSRFKTRGANPKLFDECLYSPYDYEFFKKTGRKSTSPEDDRGHSPAEDHLTRVASPRPQMKETLTSRISSPPARQNRHERRYSDSAVEVEDTTAQRRDDLIDLQDGSDNQVPNPSFIPPELVTETLPSLDSQGLPSMSPSTDFSTAVEIPEVFVYDYGTVVIWGMTPKQEERFLKDMAKFAKEPLDYDSTQVENFNFYYTKEYQARIYNDFISLRDPNNHMIKLAISHALSQSVKTSLFEDLVSTTIETTSPLPAVIAETGSMNLTRKQLNMQVGHLFILRINIHLQGSVLDSPELMWSEPQLEPIYMAVRSYLEIGQRVQLLTERLDVIADLLAVLREQRSRRHGEVLEWIGKLTSVIRIYFDCSASSNLFVVIVLIAAEILVAAINIVVDLYAGVE
ncbi:MAG: hypothetical protein Q9227_003163 [Pyrenula ochraceoflavens]